MKILRKQEDFKGCYEIIPTNKGQTAINRVFFLI